MLAPPNAKRVGTADSNRPGATAISPLDQRLAPQPASNSDVGLPHCRCFCVRVRCPSVDWLSLLRARSPTLAERARRATRDRCNSWPRICTTDERAFYETPARELPSVARLGQITWPHAKTDLGEEAARIPRAGVVVVASGSHSPIIELDTPRPLRSLNSSLSII